MIKEALKTIKMTKILVATVPSLTLTLLTRTKWWAPTNASKWRMGFNSVFKGLNSSQIMLSHLSFKTLMILHRKLKNRAVR
jgi:hypothetical protein